MTSRRSYSEVMKDIEDLNMSSKEKRLTFITALGISILVFLAPVIFFANVLLIYDNLRTMMILCITFSVMGLACLTDYLYLKGVCKDRINDIYRVYIVEFLFIVLVCSIIGFGCITIGGMLAWSLLQYYCLY